MSETAYLILSVGLFFVMILVQALLGIKHFGLVSLAGARDDLAVPNKYVDRAKRANQNMIEALVMFVPLILIAIQTGQTAMPTAVGAALFFWGRVAYAPLYWLGVPWLRTMAWAVSLLGIILIFLNLIPLIQG